MKAKNRKRNESLMVGCATFIEEWNHRVDAGLAKNKLSIPAPPRDWRKTLRRVK